MDTRCHPTSRLCPKPLLSTVSESTELPVSFITPLSDVHVYEKDEAKFELEISREPKSFRWLKGSQELSSDEKFELASEGNRHTLIVKSARYEDEAKYMFEAEDKRTSGKLIIKGKRSQKPLKPCFSCALLCMFAESLSKCLRHRTNTV